MKPKRQPESIDSRQLESLRVFHEVARDLTADLNVDSVLRKIMTKMEEFFGPEQWTLLLVDEESQQLHYALSAGTDEELLRDVRLPIGEGIAGHVAATRTPLIVDDVSAAPDWSAYAAAHPELNLQSIACLPILHGNTTLAVLQLNNYKLDLLPDTSLAFLRILCDYAAIALQNARSVNLIARLTITDDCTSLFNARHFYALLEQEIHHCTSPAGSRVISIHPECFSLLFLDLDHFKSINDTHGHLVGSALLAEIGAVIKRTLGPAHDGFRYGGDEFVCLLRQLDKPEALALSERLRTALITTTFLAAKERIHMTGSFGLATYPEDGVTDKEIIFSADTAMYEAKAGGRNRICVADPTKPKLIPPSKGSRHS